MIRPAIASILLTLVFATGVAADAVRNVLAHSDSQHVWIAHVGVQQTDQGPQDQTEILFRAADADERWKLLITIPARATALANRGPQLAVLLSSGQWMLVWSAQGAVTGTELPARGRIRAIADDGQDLWAIGDVPGGLPAATRATAATQATEPSVPLETRALPPKMVLFRENLGRWAAVDELPQDLLVPASAGVSLALCSGNPTVAAESGGGWLRVVQLRDHHWVDVSAIAPPDHQQLQAFDLLNTAGKPTLWLTAGKSSGWLYPAAVADNPVTLPQPNIGPFDSVPAIAVDGNAFCIFGVHGESLYQQKYRPDGAALGNAMAVSLGQVPQTELELWMDGTMVAALVFSVIATFWRRIEQKRAGATRAVPLPEPAPLGPRLAAGLVDLLPVLVTLLVLWFRMDLTQDPSEQLQRPGAVLALCLATAVYLLHTTLSELIWSRTLGKWIFGLRTVNLEGKRPRFVQILTRNLLRIIDLTWFPLGLILITPLRQRSADIAAGTMVVSVEAPQPAQE